MSKTTPETGAPDPALIAHLETLNKQRERAHRVLLKRRRKKSGQ